MDRQPQAPHSTLHGGLATVAAIFTILAVFVALAAWLFPRTAGSRDRDSSTPPAAADRSGGTGPAGGAGSTDPGGTPGSTYLDALTPVIGGSNLRALPRALQGRPEYAHALAIPCASGQTSDKFHDVSYSLRGRYREFRATLRPFVDPPNDIRVQIQVFREMNEVSAVAADQTVSTGLADSLVADIAGAAQLRIRITCELAGATAIITEPVLVS